MGDIVLPGNPPVQITLRSSWRARRLSLRVSSLDGRVTLTIPRGISEREALSFAREKEAWLRGHMVQRREAIRVVPETELPFRGDTVRLVQGTLRTPKLQGDTLLVPGPTETAGRRALAFLRHRARDHLAAASDHYATLLGHSYTRITLRDPRSRWGSCSSAGALMYSWRLIMAPDDVLNYVAAHEVAHLAEMNHSPAFWSLVGKIYGDTQAPRQWLRDYGVDLHRYRFED
ncbi:MULTISPECIES: M48 family metallopeptidase [Sediminimonas]|uniref:M48 family metallopeptidase n=1 Tax=Sediminimonas qiaohouensis TaxID=552061 RepID=A0A7C9LA80_9RHOB|nr:MULTISPECIES: SprT family zinc-dependent metalloprotease [Sediminimonas]MDR9483790.1 SprT family zinc-dependent metalloprotease [Sediminimonas sp.]MTJ03878.1 M48 family metallopeptidase [Sediminimonas qiaohouensis]